MVRSEDKQDDFSHIYVSASKAKMALQSNKLKVVNAGIKLFKKNAGKSSDSCRYRICSEGVATAAPYLPEARHLNVNLAELCMLIKAGYPKFDSFSEGTQRKLEMIEQGSCILRFDPLSDESYSGTMKASIVLPFYRAKCSVSLLLDKAERRSLLYRLTGEFVEVFEGLGNMTPLEAPLN